MKILIISHEFPPVGGGAGIVAKQYCDYLTAMNHDVTLMSANITDNNTWNETVYKIRPSNYKFFWPMSYYKTLNKISLDGYDRIILNDVGATLIAGLFLTKSQLKKSIIVLHGQEPEQIYTQATKIYKLFRLKAYYHRSITNAKKIIAVSKYMKEKFISLALSDAEKETIGNKILVSYTAINKNLFTLPTKKEKTLDNKLKLITVSRIEQDKGLDDCITLALKLKAAYIDFEWLIIGEGTYLKHLKFIIAQHKLEEQIKLLGRMPQEKLPYYYKNSDLFLLFSHMTESFGLVYLEAQLCGCPAIGFNKFGVKESIFHKKTGFLVNSIEDAFIIIKNKEYREVNITPTYFENFSFEQASKRLDRVINE
ncbi:glycosyltransferase family 4 protein [Providencia sp. Je.9.19]|uniref:glycosyltransferase family 4 protein n=1 Tax=Providencia sp. Je.9.19 TaxID=3142844 RepID=UPI003DAA2B08